jgi:DNA-binding CsgD family transcriptional regulator/DNA-binding MarR family transcriptional regulator
LSQAFPLLPLLDGLRVHGRTSDPRRTDIRRLLRGEFVPSEGPLSGGDAVAAAVERLLALIDDTCAIAPTALVVDDLQWADAATVRVWRQLARSVQQLPLLLVGALRPVPQRADVKALTESVRAADVIKLVRLSEAAVIELVGSLAGAPPGPTLHELARGAGGNPLYVAELIGALERSGRLVVVNGVAESLGGTAPVTLTAAIADRLGFLPEHVREILQAATLLGDEFFIGDLTVILRRKISDILPALVDAQIAGVLIENGSLMGFRHPLIRAALYDDLPVALRAALHRDAAEALAEVAAPVDRVARQLLPAADMAGDPGTSIFGDWVPNWTLDWLVAAAPKLLDEAPQVAIQLLHAAVVSARWGDQRRDVLAGHLAAALVRRGELAEAERLATQTLHRVADPDVLVSLYETLYHCAARSGRSDPEPLIRELGSVLARQDIEPRHRDRLRLVVLRAHLERGLIAAAEQGAREMLETVDQADRSARAGALAILATATGMHGDVAEALAVFDRALRLTEDESGLTDLRVHLQINQALVLIHLDRFDEAHNLLQQARQLAEGTGNLVRLARAQHGLAELLFETGRWDDALAELQAPHDISDPARSSVGHGLAALIALHRGELAEGRRRLAAAAASAEQMINRVVGHCTLARAFDLEQAGAPEQALALLAAGLPGDTGELLETEGWLADIVRLAMEVADTAMVSRVNRLAESLVSHGASPRRQAIAWHCQGLLGSDPALLLRAADGYRAADRPLPRAQALEAAAGLLADRAAGARAGAAAMEAFEAYAGLGAEWDIGRLRSRFADYGVGRDEQSPRARAKEGWASLTETELDVAELVGEGLSNPQIADRLSLSRHTVQAHVSRVLRKLGVSSRIAISREAARHRRNPPDHPPPPQDPR